VARRAKELFAIRRASEESDMLTLDWVAEVPFVVGGFATGIMRRSAELNVSAVEHDADEVEIPTDDRPDGNNLSWGKAVNISILTGLQPKSAKRGSFKAPVCVFSSHWVDRATIEMRRLEVNQDGLFHDCAF
jgi:hypothetical protein